MVFSLGTETDQRSGGTLVSPQDRPGDSRAADIPALLSHSINIKGISPKGQLIFSVSAPPFLLGVLCSLLLYLFIKADMHGPLWVQFR